ncbi:SusC/RagA family TonB-linked outer membrane protein [Bacteroidia bacterium]|nr:SusC/RagA family TonB-linked outer membrane protein [Bacteroidia bacterium]
MLCATGGVFAQDMTGSVVDAHTKRPLMGARVRVAETNLSSITDEAGVFKLQVPSSTAAVLIVSMVDYAEREVPVQGKSETVVELYPANFASGYGAVNTLKGSTRNALVTNSAAEASGFANSTAMSVESEMQSRLGGDVRVLTRSGTPGIGASLFIRGINSLNANAQPLFVVDGVVWDNQLNNASIHKGNFSNPLTNIDVRNIESITVLKDGASLYGSKAANGVVLIKTVRGRDQVTRITANLLLGITETPALPKMMDAGQYRTFASNQVDGYIKDNGGGRPMENDIVRTFPFLNDDNTTSAYKNYHNNTNWGDEVYQSGMSQSILVDVNGGDEIALYNLSMGSTTNEGTIQNTGMSRLNARFNSDIKLHEKIFSRVNISISRTVSTLRDEGVDAVTSPGFLALVKSPLLTAHGFHSVTGEPTKNYMDFDDLGAYRDRDRWVPVNALSNPMALVANALGNTNRTVFNMTLNPYINFTKDVTLSTIFGYSLHREKESFFVPKDGLAPQRLNLFGRADNEVRDYAQRQGAIFSDTKLNWNLRLNADNSLALLGGFRYMNDSYESDLPRGYNTGNDNTKTLVEGLGYRYVTGENDEWKSMSWYANAAYDYQHKYFLAVTASADASSRFGKKTEAGFGLAGHRWGLFPAVEAGWIVSSEEFMRNVPAINFLKLRAGYSITGNDDINAFAGRSYFAPITFVDKAVGIGLANIENEGIQWETSKKASAGIEAHILNEQLSLSLDVFSSQTDNLLTLKTLEAITGLDTYWSNGGSLKNSGFEFAVDAKVLNTPLLTWELGASVGHYKNEITALPDGTFDTELLGGTVRTAVGQPAGVFYGYKTNGVYATTGDAETANLYKENTNGTYTKYQAGDVRFVDVDKTPNRDGYDVINAADRQIIGDPNPDFYGTITSRLKHRRWGLDLLFTYSEGNDVYNYLRSQLESGANFYNQTVAMTNRWKTEDDVTDMPRAVYGDPMGNNAFSDRWLEDGSYLRLKALTVSYAIPFDLPYLQGITVWATVNNLYTWTSYLGSDPEFSMNNTVLGQGIDAGLRPQSRSYYLGVRVNL